MTRKEKVALQMPGCRCRNDTMSDRMKLDEFVEEGYKSEVE